jgi:hypothetical protein
MTIIYEHFDPLIGESVETATALPSSGNWPNRTVMAEDTKIVHVWNGSAWRANSVQQKLVNTTTAGPFKIFSGMDALRGSGGAGLAAPFTFPTAFSAVPCVVANVIGYKTHSATFAPTGLSNGSEYAQAQSPTTAGFTMYLTPPSGTLSTAFDWYVTWIAIGFA